MCVHFTLPIFLCPFSMQLKNRDPLSMSDFKYRQVLFDDFRVAIYITLVVRLRNDKLDYGNREKITDELSILARSGARI